MPGFFLNDQATVFAWQPTVVSCPPRTARRIAPPRYQPAPYLSPLARTTTPGQLTDQAKYLVAVRGRSRRRRHIPTFFLEAPLYLAPLAVPGTPGQLVVQAHFLRSAARTRREMQQRTPHSRIRPPRVITGSTLLVTDSVTSGTAGAIGSAAIVHPNPVLIKSPPWRFVVVYLDPTNAGGKRGAVITFLDRIATARTVTFELDMPAQAQGTVDSDNFEVNLIADPAHGYDGQPYLAEGNRLLYGFRREGTWDANGNYAPWVCRFAGLILQIGDAVNSGGGGDQPKSTFTAFDPWMYLYNRPVVNADGTLPGRDGLSSTRTGAGTYDFPSKKAGDIALTLLKRTIHYHGPVWIDAGVSYGGTSHYGSSGANLGPTDDIDITFQQGCTVGEAWKQLCDTNQIDIALRPIYDPVNRPGYLCELAIHAELGIPRDNAIFAWDLPSRSLLGIDRLEDGSQRANIAQFFTQGGVPVQPPAIDGVGPLGPPVYPGPTSQHYFGEYWALQTLTGQAGVGALSGIPPSYIYALMLAAVAIRKLRSTTIRLDPAPARAPIPISEYNIGDTVPIYASRRLRKPINGTGRVYKIPVVIDDDGVERVEELEFSADSLMLSQGDGAHLPFGSGSGAGGGSGGGSAAGGGSGSGGGGSGGGGGDTGGSGGGGSAGGTGFSVTISGLAEDGETLTAVVG